MNERLKNGLVNLGLVVASVVVFFVIAEGYFAVFDPQLNPQTPQIQPTEGEANNSFHFYQYDEMLGWVPKPNAEGIYAMSDSKTQIEINSKGIRDKSYDYKKPEGIKRIVVLGDSFTWGYGVEEKNIFTEILEDELFKNIQVINMGVSGYGSDQELLFLEEEGIMYNPDLVVVAFYVGNDITNNINSIQYNHPKPMYVLDDEDNKLILTNTPVPQKEEWLEVKNNDNVTILLSFKRFMSHHSHAYAFISDRIVSSPNLLNLFKKIGIADKRTTPMGEAVLKHRLELDPYGWNLTKAILKEIDTVAKANNAKTFVIIIPTREQVNKNWDSEINGALVDFGKESNIPVLDLLPEFREHAKNGEQLYFKIDGHWNANGHKLAAELIYDKLVEEELVPLGGEQQWVNSER